MSLGEVEQLAIDLYADDMARASQAAEELVDVLLYLISSDKPDSRQGKIGSMESVRVGLVHLLMTGNDDARYWACVALSYIAHKNAENIRRIGNTPRVFDGIFRTLALPDCQSVACGVLSQLAFCNQENSQLISETEGLLDRLVHVMRNGRPGDQQAATCALSNCAANSNAVALKIVAVPDMVPGLTELCVCGDVDPDLAAQTAHDPRTTVSAIGCMDNLSYYEEVRPMLQEEKVIDVLIPIMKGGMLGRHEGSRVMAAESAMIVTRLISTNDLEELSVERDVLATIMHCLRCAIDGEQWANFAWRLGDVIEPLYRLSLNRQNCLLMTGEGICKELIRVLQFDEEEEEYRHSSTKCCVTESGHAHCIETLCNVSSYSSCFSALKGVRVVVPRRPCESKNGDDEWVFLTAADVLETARQKGSGLVRSNLWALRERNMAIFMSLHPRLGEASLLSCLDECILREIVDASSTSAITSRELARALRGKGASFFGVDMGLKVPAWGERRGANSKKDSSEAQAGRD